MKQKYRHLISISAALILGLQTAVLPAAADSDDDTVSKPYRTAEDGSILPDEEDETDTDDPDKEKEPDDDQGEDTDQPDSKTDEPKRDADGLFDDDYYYADDEYDEPIKEKPDYYTPSEIDWTYKRGVLTISGTGPMQDYYGSYDTPWSEFCFVIEEVQVLDGVTYISDNAFADMERLEEVHIADSVTEIGEYTFQGDYNLISIDLPAHLEKIGSYAFANCYLETIEIPETVREIGESAFWYNDYLQEVVLHEGLETIGANCFSQCNLLEDIEIPMSVTSIGAQIFDNCSTLMRKYKGSLIIVGDGFLVGCNDLSSEITVPEGVKHICAGAFMTITKDYEDDNYWGYTMPDPYLEILNLPESLIDIDSCAFCDLPELQKVRFPKKMKSIGSMAFRYCTMLWDVTMPEELESIGEEAFSECPYLYNLDIPETVTYIGADAFYHTAFYKNWKDDFIILGDGILCAYYGSDKRLELPEGIKYINGHAFNHSNVVEVKCPDSLRCIRKEAFINTDLVKIQFNEGLEKLEAYAIDVSRDCYSLYIPESLKDFRYTSVQAKLKYVIGNSRTAEKFSEIYNCELLDKDPDRGEKTDSRLDPKTECWSFGNFGFNYDNEYYFTPHDLEIVRGLTQSGALLDKKEWTGACFGMTATILLVKAGLIQPDEIQPHVNSLSQIKPTKAVQSFINYYHNIQYLRAFTAGSTVKSDVRMFYDMIQEAENLEYGGLPFMISFQTPDLGHALLGYDLEEGSWEIDGRTYDRRIVVWDPNSPTTVNEDAFLYYDNKTFEYCIPYYNLTYVSMTSAENTGRILYYCNDLSRLNPYPYEFVPNDDFIYLSGDCNCDGTVDISDAVLLARFCAEETDANLSADGHKLADVNEDGVITPDDTIKLLRIIAKIDEN